MFAFLAYLEEEIKPFFYIHENLKKKDECD